MAGAGFLGATAPYQPTIWDRLAVAGASLRSDPRWLAQAQDQIKERAALAQQAGQAATVQRLMATLTSDDGSTQPTTAGPSPSGAAPALSPTAARLLGSAPQTGAPDAAAPAASNPAPDTAPPSAPAPAAMAAAAPQGGMTPARQKALLMLGLLNPEAANSMRATLDGNQQWTPDGAGGFFDAHGPAQPAAVPQLDKGMVLDRTTNTVHAAPGYAKAAADIAGATAGAQEDAKAADDVIAVPMPDGSTRSMSRGTFLTMQRLGVLAPGVGSGQSTADKATIDASARAAYEKDDRVNPDGSVTYGVTAQRTGAAPFTPHAAGSRPPSASFSTSATASGAGPSAAATAYQTENAKALATQANDYRTGLQAGLSRAAAIQQLQDLNNKGVGQGGLNPMGMEVSNALTSLGYNSPKLNNAQAFQGLRSILLNGATQGSGIQVRNQREFDAFMKRIPDTDVSTAARGQMLGYLAKAQAQQNAEAQAAMSFMSHAGPAGLAGQITGRDGKSYTWDQVHSEFLRRNPVKY